MPTSTGDDLIRTVGRAIGLEAQRNEQRVGLVRLFGFGLIFLMDLALGIFGINPLQNATTSFAAMLISLLITWLLHRRFRSSDMFVLPAVDAVAVYFIVTPRLETELTSGLVAIVSMACGLLAATGGTRLDWRAGVWTTALGLMTVFATVGRFSTRLEMVYISIGVVSLGLLNLWMSELVRRYGEQQRARGLLSRMVGTKLLERVYTDPEGLLTGPANVEVTILVSDLRGFTGMAEKLSPAQVLETLNEIQGAFAGAVMNNGGTIDKFMGDGMLAVFGSPQPLVHHAAAALQTARALREAIRAFNDRSGLDPIRVGIGIHTGKVISGFLGGSDRIEFTVIGDAVNVASRLESLTKERGVDVILSAATAEQAPQFPLVDLGEAPLKGRTATLHVYGLAN